MPLKLQPRPIFYRIGVQVPSDANYAIVIPPYLALKGTNGKVYFDGVVLAEGAHSTTPPQFSDPSAVEGSWDGHLFSNLIDNGSAEQPALRVRPAVDQATVRLLSKFGSLSSIFSTLGDWRGTSWYYRDTFFTMLRTFWASVAADKFNLPGTLPNNFLLVLTVLGLLGAARMLWRKRRELRWDILFILFAALVVAWAMAALRGVSSLSLTFPIVTRARYAFPAILPTALLICAGWLEWLEWLGDRLAIPRKIVHLIPVGFMMLLSLFTLFNIVKFFHPSAANIKWLFPVAAVLGLAVWLFARQANRLNTPSP